MHACMRARRYIINCKHTGLLLVSATHPCKKVIQWGIPVEKAFYVSRPWSCMRMHAWDIRKSSDWIQGVIKENNFDAMWGLHANASANMALVVVVVTNLLIN